MNIDNITSDGIALSNNGKEMLIKVYEQEIKRLKEEYVILQNASDEVEEEKDKEIERLNNIINRAIEYMERYMFSQKENYDYIHLLDILKGSDKE